MAEYGRALFFRDIATERLRRGLFTSVPELVTAIDEYVAQQKVGHAFALADYALVFQQRLKLSNLVVTSRLTWPIRPHHCRTGHCS